MRFAIIIHPLSLLLTLPGCDGNTYKETVSPIHPEDGPLVTPVTRNGKLSQDARAKKTTELIGEYLKLKETDPDAALEAFKKAGNLVFHEHPLAEEWAALQVRGDMAGEMLLTDMIRLTEIELAIAKDADKPDRAHIKQIEKELEEWQQRLVDAEAGMAAVKIKFEIIVDEEAN